jgi:hypothetical protein
VAINSKLSFTDQAAAFSAAAAYGITQRVVNTWNPYLLRTPRVLVPVQVDALVIRPGQAATTWADCALKPHPGTAGVTRRDVLPAPFAELATPRTSGIYLHWALPDALTAGTTDANAACPNSSDTACFPAAPDRWLVMRMSPSTDGQQRRAVTGWVLRSGDQNPVPIDLDSFSEGMPSQDAISNPLTVLGQGDVAWAAYYDNVVNRLAFYDNLQGIRTGPLAYMACGWYSNPSQDPLGDTNVKSITDFNNKMASMGWQLAQGELNEAVNHSRNYILGASKIGLTMVQAKIAPLSDIVATNVSTQYATSDATPSFPPVDPSGEALGPYTTDGSWWPNATLFHGSVVAIGWPQLGWPGNENGLLSGEQGGPPAASGITVAVGNTIPEALSALVAQKNQSPDEARILEAFLLGVLPQLNEANGRPTVDAALHASSFASLDGGSTTEQLWIPQMPDTPAPLPNPVTPSPGIFSNQAKVAYQQQAFQSGQFTTTVVQPTGKAQAQHFVAKQTLLETTFRTGGLIAAMSGVITPQAPQAPIPGHYETVKRALPRYYYPAEPVILIEGAARSFKHGSDDRFSQDDTLTCRLTGFVVTELSCTAVAGQTNRPSIQGQDALDRGVENGSVPPECEDLLRETVLLDPGAAVVLAQTSQGLKASSSLVSQVAQNFTVEQTVWWATRDPNFDHAPLIALSGIAGTLPAAMAVSPPVKPWNPLHLDWSLQYIPSTNSVKDWSLGEIDYTPNSDTLPPMTDTQAGILLQGRAHLTGGSAATAAASLRRAMDQALAAGGSTNLTPNLTSRYHSILAQASLKAYAALPAAVKANITAASGTASTGEIPPVDRAPLQDILTTLSSMDVLSGALDSFTQGLRGGYDPDGVDKPTDGSVPTPFVPLRAGFLRILRLRLVDCFGQFLDLAGSSDSANVDLSQLIDSEPVQVSQNPGIVSLPPRFTSPSRLWFRYMAADGTENEANDTTSPICGYLVPNHLDGDLEFFDDAGTNLGVVRPDPHAGIVWEEAPGQPSTVGQSPERAITNGFASGIAQGLLRWGLADATQDAQHEDALSALLRIIDSTLWAVDPFGHTGDEHLSLLIGHPVAVMRCRLRLEVNEPIHPELLNTISVGVKLGAVPDFQDGLLGYFVNDDYTRLYCADAAIAGFARQVGPGRGFLQQANLVPDFYQTFSDDLGATVTEGASPVTHPYVDTSGVLAIQPNQEIPLTLLVEPQTVVHATPGLLPSKDVGMRRNWVAAALAVLSPTFRFGPVLVDPQKIRMPVPTGGIQGSWSWDHRSSITDWAEDPVVNATDDAQLSPDPIGATEGWLRLKPVAPASNGSGNGSVGGGGGS